MSRSAFILLFIFSLNLSQVFTSRIKIEPDSQMIIKYAGDSVNLTCFIDLEDRKDKHHLSSQDISNTPSYTLNWILPSNGEDRVEYLEQKDRVTIYVKDLEETDHGYYTCNLHSENKPLPQTSSIYLDILPRGKLSSCNSKSFYCEKTFCIPDKYKCDGIPDCPNGLDEMHQYCGSDPCSEKLPCKDGRCLSPSECCREPSRSPPNCTIYPTIQCCRQLVHPALLDQDLHYLESRVKVKQDSSYFQTTTSLLIGGFLLLMTFITMGLVISLRYRFCRPYSTHPSNWPRSTPPLSPWLDSNRGPQPTDQYLLQSSNSSVDRTEFIRQIPGLRSDLLSPSVLRNQSNESALVLVPLSQARIPLVPLDFGGPPPSYQQAIGAPPPPYSFENESFGRQSLEVPLLTPSEASVLFHNNNNNNNGDINGNITSRHHPLGQNRNLSGGTMRSTNASMAAPIVTSSSFSSSSSFPSTRSLSSSSSSSSSSSFIFSGSSQFGTSNGFPHHRK